MDKMRSIFIATTLLFAVTSAQQAGNFTPEIHPTLTTQKCSLGGNCTTIKTSLVQETDQRPLRSISDPSILCYSNGTWNAGLCPDPVTCAKNCAPDGVDYSKILTIKENGTAFSMKLEDGSPRVYLLSEDENKYQMFFLKNQEFTYDVDMSLMPCGTNGALYFINMHEDGGLSELNTAGPAKGTGYCDAQCPTYIRWIDGEANLNSTYGSCCPEMDIWEANKVATAYTPHTCTPESKYTCDSRIDGQCDACDRGGCDFNPYRLGNTTFYGPERIIDTNRVFKVITQFFTADNTTATELVEIRRLYVQDGEVIQNSRVEIPDFEPYDSLSAEYCVEEKAVFNGTDDFTRLGGLPGFSRSLDLGMVLSMSIWADSGSYMQWLDGVSPINATNPDAPGVRRGPCGVEESIPANIEANFDPAVTFANLKFGDIGSTF